MCYFKFLKGNSTTESIGESTASDSSTIVLAIVIPISIVAVAIMTLIFIVFIINIMHKRYRQLYGK